jgi:hypothetical protein
VCGGGGGGWGRGVDSAAIPTEDALKRVGRGEHEVDACGRLGMAVRPVGAGVRGRQTHWVRVWVSNRTRGCTHTRTHNKLGRGRVWISTRG